MEWATVPAPLWLGVSTMIIIFEIPLILSWQSRADSRWRSREIAGEEYRAIVGPVD